MILICFLPIQLNVKYKKQLQFWNGNISYITLHDAVYSLLNLIFCSNWKRSHIWTNLNHSGGYLHYQPSSIMLLLSHSVCICCTPSSQFNLWSYSSHLKSVSCINLHHNIEIVVLINFFLFPFQAHSKLNILECTMHTV